MAFEDETLYCMSFWFVYTKLMDEMCYVLCRFVWTGFVIPLPDMAAATHVLGMTFFCNHVYFSIMPILSSLSMPTTMYLSM